MAQATHSPGSMVVSTVIHAPRQAVYQAFLDPVAVAAWLAPGNMQLHVHTFEPREGGQFRMSLRYHDPAPTQRGKTSADTDTYHGRFAKLVPNEEIVEVIEFETTDPGMMGEMSMTVTLADAAGGTELSLRYDNLPTAIRPEDNEAGTRESLAKLAALLEKLAHPRNPKQRARRIVIRPAR